MRRALCSLVAVLATTLAANAGIVVYSGSDNGAPVGGPFPNSTTAANSFKAAATGYQTITFESQPVGFTTPFTAAPGVNVSIAAPNFGPGFSGISNTTLGNLYGFNTTAGGSKWLGFAGGSATFNFADPVEAFGFWLTGVQTVFTSAITVTFDDGTSQTLFAPVNVDGGASFFGFTDFGKSIASITISNPSNDAWGIDDVYYLRAAVPEPVSVVVFGGLLAAGGLAVRRRRTATA